MSDPYKNASHLYPHHAIDAKQMSSGKDAKTGTQIDYEAEQRGFRKGLQRAIELIPEKVDAPQTELIIRGYNQANKELRQALEAELDSNSMKIEGIKKESNQ